MYDTQLSVGELLTRLREGPQRIAALTAGLTAAQLRARPTFDEWSENDILAHLRSCSDVWGDNIRTILAEDGPTIKAINPTTWIKRTDYPDLDFQPSFEAFAAQRAELVAALAELTPAQWERRATVTGAGKALQRTVMSYAMWLANHERSHFKSIGQIAKQLQNEGQE